MNKEKQVKYCYQMSYQTVLFVSELWGVFFGFFIFFTFFFFNLKAWDAWNHPCITYLPLIKIQFNALKMDYVISYKTFVGIAQKL